MIRCIMNSLQRITRVYAIPQETLNMLKDWNRKKVSGFPGVRRREAARELKSKVK